MKKLFLFLFFGLSLLVHAENKSVHFESIPLNKVIAIYEDQFVRIPPPQKFLEKSAADVKCNIVVEYMDFPDSAKEAFEYAVTIWESLLVSGQVIHVQAHWVDLKEDGDRTILGAAGSSNFYIDEEGLPDNSVFYNAPLAEKLARRELTRPGEPDMYAFFNKEETWYFGVDGLTPGGTFDFVSVVLHELCHGLGFIGSLDVLDDSNEGIWGFGSKFPFSFDRFVVNDNEDPLIDQELFPNPSTKLFDQLNGNKLFFSGPVVNNNIGSKVSLYAPDQFNSGSSVDHLNVAYDDTEHRLMTPGIKRATSIHDPGFITLSIMEDLGWSSMFISHTPLTNSEEISNLIVEAHIEADFDTDFIDAQLNYAINNGAFQTVDLVSAGESSKYTAEIIIKEYSDVQYYLSVKDKYGRLYHYPNSAPSVAQSVSIGIDAVEPHITHLPNNQFFIGDSALVILADIYDAYGIDTVFVEYRVNGVDKTPLGLHHLLDDTYNVVINLRDIDLELHDTIEYRIIAADAAFSRNISTHPHTGFHQLVINELPEFVESYSTTFESGVNEFILDGFDFSIADGFDDATLNSKHPYDNGGENTWLNFTAELKFPVRIKNEDHFIEFYEIALIEPGEEGVVFGDDDFFDYVVVEGSKDKGETWIPFEDGWDSGMHQEWSIAYEQSKNFNNTKILAEQNLFQKHLIDLTGPDEFSPEDIIRIRFRLHSDPYEVGWGWSINNMDIQTIGLDNKFIAREKYKIYPNPVNNSEFTLEGISEPIKLLRIYDFTGRLVFQLKNLNKTNNIVVPASIKGLHILRIEGANSVYQTKLQFN